MYSNKNFVGYFTLKRFCILIISEVIATDTVIRKTNEMDSMVHVVVKKRKWSKAICRRKNMNLVLKIFIISFKFFSLCLIWKRFDVLILNKNEE